MSSKDEDKLQVAAMRYIRYQYPKLIAFHVANEGISGPKGKAYGTKMRAKGVLAGCPDIHILEPMGVYSGLFIELKTPTGRVSPAQKIFLDNLNSKGYCAKVCRSLDEVIETVDHYMTTM
jgi:hypothetical protein